MTPAEFADTAYLLVQAEVPLATGPGLALLPLGLRTLPRMRSSDVAKALVALGKGGVYLHRPVVAELAVHRAACDWSAKEVAMAALGIGRLRLPQTETTSAVLSEAFEQTAHEMTPEDVSCAVRACTAASSLRRLCGKSRVCTVAGRCGRFRRTRCVSRALGTRHCESASSGASAPSNVESNGSRCCESI
jgi:hypothetical protein